MLKMLTKAQLRMFHLLIQNGGASLEHLGTLYGITKQGVYDHLQALVRKGYVEIVVGEGYLKHAYKPTTEGIEQVMADEVSKRVRTL